MDLSVHNRYQPISNKMTSSHHSMTSSHNPYKTEFVVNWLLKEVDNKSEKQKNNDKSDNSTIKESQPFHTWEESWSILRKFQDTMIATQGVCLFKRVNLFQTLKY